MLHRTGNIVVLDSGLYVLRLLLSKNNKGVHGSDIINKKRHYPRYTGGEKSGLASPTRVLRPWKQFVASLNIFLFVYFI